MKNFIIGFFTGSFTGVFLMIWLARNEEEVFDKQVETWRTI